MPELEEVILINLDILFAGKNFNKIEYNKGQYNNSVNIFWASGACMFVNQKSWISLGGFDEDFFMHQEEIDFVGEQKI